MITVNDTIYAAYGGEEGYKKYKASHETYEYVEDRLVFSDMLEQNILIDMLLHIHEDIIPHQILDEIYDEINNQPITIETPSRIKNRVENVIIDNPDTIDEFARSEITRILTLIDAAFDLLNVHNDRLNEIKQWCINQEETINNYNTILIRQQELINNQQDRIVENEQKLQQNDLKLSELYNTIKILYTSSEDIKRTNRKQEQSIKSFNSQINNLNNKIIELTNKNKELEEQISTLLKHSQPNNINNNNKTKYRPSCNNNGCACGDNLYGRYRSIYGMVI